MTDEQLAALIAAVDAWDEKHAPPDDGRPMPEDDGLIGRAREVS